LIFVFPEHVVAQDVNEGRISEHNVISIVALSGLIIFANIIRKKRKIDLKEK
jgi:hypothetical protein